MVPRATKSSGKKQSLLVVGPGVLGGFALGETRVTAVRGGRARQSTRRTASCEPRRRRHPPFHSHRPSNVAVEYLRAHPDATAVAQTATTTNHDRLACAAAAAGIPADRLVLRTSADAPAADAEAPHTHVVFSAPPSGSEDYPGEVAAALARWAGPADGGRFVFTSSAGLYQEDGCGVVTETSPIASLGESPRLDRLLQAEAAVLAAGGCVVRLTGLYHRDRGAHTHFLKMGVVPRPGNYLLNLVHYEDAARLTLAALDGDRSEPGSVYLGADGSPLEFKAMTDACLASGLWPDATGVEYTGDESVPTGKVLDASWTREALGWAPVYPSFASLVVDARGEDAYRRDPEGLGGLGLAHGQGPRKSHKE